MSDRLNTIFGWLLFSGIVALGLSSVSSHIFKANKHERPEVMGYPIEGVVEEGGADSGPSLAQLLNEGSAEAGEAVFAKCQSCHTINQGGANGIGPNLYGTVGEPIGKGKAGFAFSSALADHGGNWTYENLDEWLKSPRAFASGTKMSFAGLSSAEDRANIILYMRENGGGPAIPEYTPEAEGGDESAADGEEFPGEGPGEVEGAPVSGVQAAGAMSDDQPVPGEGTTAPVE